MKKRHPKGIKVWIDSEPEVRKSRSLEAIQSNGHNNPLNNKNLTRENTMDVVMTFIKTESENVQHGALLAESATNPIIGKMYVVNYLQEDGQIKGRSEAEKTDPWLMKSEILCNIIKWIKHSTQSKYWIIVDMANSVNNSEPLLQEAARIGYFDHNDIINHKFFQT